MPSTIPLLLLTDVLYYLFCFLVSIYKFEYRSAFKVSITNNLTKFAASRQLTIPEEAAAVQTQGSELQGHQEAETPISKPPGVTGMYGVANNSNTDEIDTGND